MTQVVGVLTTVMVLTGLSIQIARLGGNLCVRLFLLKLGGGVWAGFYGKGKYPLNVLCKMLACASLHSSMLIHKINIPVVILVLFDVLAPLSLRYVRWDSFEIVMLTLQI